MRSFHPAFLYLWLLFCQKNRRLFKTMQCYYPFRKAQYKRSFLTKHLISVINPQEAWFWISILWNPFLLCPAIKRPPGLLPGSYRKNHLSGLLWGTEVTQLVCFLGISLLTKKIDGTPRTLSFSSCQWLTRHPPPLGKLCGDKTNPSHTGRRSQRCGQQYFLMEMTLRFKQKRETKSIPSNTILVKEKSHHKSHPHPNYR